MKNNRSPVADFLTAIRAHLNSNLEVGPRPREKKENENLGFLTILPTEISPGPKDCRGLIYGRLSYNAPENSASFFSETSKVSLF